TVTAFDPFNNIDVNYAGAVRFTTLDASPGVVLPPDTMFTGADAGVHTFASGVTLVTAGSETLTVTDLIAGITSTITIVISPAALDHLLISAPDTVISGVAFDVAVAAQDAFSNTVTTYVGTVQFAST